MQKLFSIGIASQLLALTATAMPTNGEALIKRASPGLYLCENSRFQGYCYHYQTPWGVCTTITDRFPSGVHGVSAAGADPGNWCTLYSEEGCHGQEFQVYYPGYEDLSQTSWNDRAKSYNCAALRDNKKTRTPVWSGSF